MFSLSGFESMRLFGMIGGRRKKSCKVPNITNFLLDPETEKSIIWSAVEGGIYPQFRNRPF